MEILTTLGTIWLACAVIEYGAKGLGWVLYVIQEASEAPASQGRR